MAAPKTLKTLAGDTPKAAAIAAGDPATKIPLDEGALAATILQLQNSLNEVITRLNALVTDFNAHTHSGVTVGAGVTGAKSSAAVTAVTGAAQTATNLFTAS